MHMGGWTGMGKLTEKSPRLVASVTWTIVRIAVIFAIAYGVHLLMDWVITRSENLSADKQSLMLTSLLVAMLVAYAVLISVPFVPGIEIGLSLIILRGPAIVPYVFLATLTGLSLAYFAGRYIRYSWLRKVFLDLGLKRPAEFLESIQALPAERRIELLCARLPDWLGPHLVRWRYVMLAALINIPGNALIGGGGGICLVAGLSRVFAPLATFLTLVIAVAPVPLIVWFFDINLSGK